MPFWSSSLGNFYILTSSELNPEHQWEVTSVRKDKEIYPDYAKRFSHTFPALVRVVVNHVWMEILAWILFWWFYICTWADVCPCTQTAATGQWQRQTMVYWYSMSCDRPYSLFSWQIGSLGRELAQLQQESKQHLQLSQQQVSDCTSVLAECVCYSSICAL